MDSASSKIKRALVSAPLFFLPFVASAHGEPLAEAEALWSAPVIVGAIVFSLLLVVLLEWGVRTKKYKKMLVLGGLLAVGALLSYSLYFTLSSGALKSGIVTCLEDGQCFWTAHIHSYLVIRACGEEKNLPLQTAPLTGAHTHNERNIFHWHDRLPYDNAEKKIADTAPLTLGSSFGAIEVTFGNMQVFEKKNGDLCGDGAAGAWKMFVNGKFNSEWGNYIWHDKDVIHLIFDNRTPEEIEEAIKLNPIAFPVLGRG